MNRVYFNIRDFPKFIDAAESCTSWTESFSKFGYKSYEHASYRKDRRNSLSAEEYTWFVLRWS
jgi:hypothetical protein